MRKLPPLVLNPVLISEAIDELNRCRANLENGVRMDAVNVEPLHIPKRKRKSYGKTPDINAAKERDEYKCQICGESRVLNVHHINGRGGKNPHRIENLITLCPNCHALVHAGELPLPHLSLERSAHHA